MKTIQVLPAIILFATAAIAQEIQPIPAEQAEKIGRKILATLGSPADAPFAVDADASKGAGIKAGDLGMLAQPDRKVTAEAVDAAGKEPVALGHLWMRMVVPSVNGTAADPAKLRTVTVKDGDTNSEVP